MRPFSLGLCTRSPFITCSRALHNSIVAPQAKKPFHPTFFLAYKQQNNPDVAERDYFENEALKIPIANNYIDELKDLYWKKYLARRDLNTRAQDGFIGKPIDAVAYGLPKIDMDDLRAEYADIDALQNCDEKIRKIYTLKYGTRSDWNKVWKKKMLEKCGYHHYEKNSLPQQVIWTTAVIRHWTLLEDQLQVKMPGRRRDMPRPKWLSVKIAEMLHHRRRLLQQLKDTDRDEFDRIIKKLKISYRLEDPKSVHHINRTRKRWTEAQVLNRIKWEKDQKLEALRKQVEENREEKAKAIDDEIQQLRKEEAQIRLKMIQLDKLENLYCPKPKGKYVPDIVGEYALHAEHDRLGMFFDSPKVKLIEDSDLAKVARNRKGGKIHSLGIHTKKMHIKYSDLKEKTKPPHQP